MFRENQPAKRTHHSLVKKRRRKGTYKNTSQTNSNQSQAFKQKKQNIKMKAQFKEYNDKRYNNRAKRRILDYVHQNIIPGYKQQYNFQQAWEKQKDISSEDKLLWFIKQSSNAYFILSFFVMLLRMAVVWYTSIRRVFQANFFNQIYLSLLLLLIGQEVLYIIKYIKQNGMQFKKQNNDVFQIIKNIFLIIYCALAFTKFIDVDFGLFGIDIIFIYFEFQKCADLYKVFRKILISSRFKNQLNIFDLMTTLLIVGHLFSVLLYTSVIINPNPLNNWTSKISFNLTLWQDKYIYSLYFAFSTMLTVGYGDIAPVNQLQIITILVVQIVGVAFFGYVVSQIGSNLSNIRKSQQQLQHNIGMIQYLSEYYDLNKDVTIKVRDYLVANQKAQQKFKTQDQDKFLAKISEDLRQDITNQTNTKLIRKSLFFICGWSKNFRNQMAKKLMKKVFSPNDYLVDNLNSEIFIIQKGEIKIFAEKKNRGKACLRKQVKTLVSCSDAQILMNVYGYSRILTTKIVSLVARAKSCVVAYVLSRQSFEQVVRHQSIDNQYFYELKHKMTMKKIPQLMEVPDLINNRQHYQPSPFFLAKKKSRFENALKTSNKRNSFNRKQKQIGFLINNDEINISESRIPLFINRTSKMFSANKQDNEILGQFQRERQYKNYFTKGNLDRIIHKMQISQF